MKLFSLCVAFLLVGCGPGEIRERQKTFVECDQTTAERRSEFILRCIEGGNPKSDEEPEDWMPLCMRKADDLFCPKKAYVVTEQDQGSWWMEISRRPAEALK